MIRVQTEAIDPGALLAGFCRGRTDVGGVVSFTGLTRGATDGAAVSRLSLEGAVICGWPLRCKSESGLMFGSVGVRSSVRPVGAALMAAGPDGVR